MGQHLPRVLDLDELELAGGFWVEVRTIPMRTYTFGAPHICRYIFDGIVHMKLRDDAVMGRVDSYNIWWRAWLLNPSDELRKSTPWLPPRNPNGEAYGWDFEPRQALSEREMIIEAERRG